MYWRLQFQIPNAGMDEVWSDDVFYYLTFFLKGLVLNQLPLGKALVRFDTVMPRRALSCESGGAFHGVWTPVFEGGATPPDSVHR